MSRPSGNDLLIATSPSGGESESIKSSTVSAYLFHRRSVTVFTQRAVEYGVYVALVENHAQPLKQGLIRYRGALVGGQHDNSFRPSLDVELLIQQLVMTLKPCYTLYGACFCL
jgi:hypothetical protein